MGGVGGGKGSTLSLFFRIHSFRETGRTMVVWSVLLACVLAPATAQYAMAPFGGGAGSYSGCTPCMPPPPPPPPPCPVPPPCPPQFCPPPPICPPPPPPPPPCPPRIMCPPPPPPPPPPMPVYNPCMAARPYFNGNYGMAGGYGMGGMGGMGGGGYGMMPRYGGYAPGGCGGGPAGYGMAPMPMMPQNDCCCGCASPCRYRSRRRMMGSKTAARDNNTVDPACNSEQLRQIIDKYMTSDTSESKRAIQTAAQKEMDGLIDVVCGKGEFSYIAHTEQFCQHSRDEMTCYAFRPLAVPA